MTDKLAWPLTFFLLVVGTLLLDKSTAFIGRGMGHLFMVGFLFLYRWLLRKGEQLGWGMILAVFIVSTAALLYGNPILGVYGLVFGFTCAVSKLWWTRG